MKAVTLALLLVLVAPRLADAHGAKSQRSVVVQLESDRALLLVTWTAPTGVLGRLMMIRAALSQEDPRKALSALMGKHALDPVSVELDGNRATFDSVETKLTLDTSNQRRHTVTLLATLRLRGAGRIRVRAASKEPTRLLWTRGKTASPKAQGSRPAQVWAGQEINLTVSPR